VTNNNVCHDTSYYPFEVIKVVADFEAVDSFLNCAPIYAEFISKSSFADTLIWDFGAGDVFKTTSTSAGTIYAKNSGFTNGYDIKLVAKNKQGCTDTLLKEDYMVVAGPLPKFSMTNFSGCEPLEVSFTDESEDGAYFFMNYNDGSILDSSKSADNIIGPHSFVIQSFNALRQTVMPSIIVYDSLGCASVFEPLDSIEIFRNPDANLVFKNGKESCNPFNIVFEDTGSFTDTRQWSLDGVDISTSSKDSILKTAEGINNLMLVARNNNNCFDTVYQDFKVLEKPKVSFIKDDTICINNSVNFGGELSSKSFSVDNFTWTFGEPSSPKNKNTTNLETEYTYSTIGVKEIKLVASLNNGCSDSATQMVTITDASFIDNPQINFVTFKDNYTVEVNYEKSTIDKFKTYRITSSSGLYQVNNVDQTTFETSLATAPVVSDCYTLQVGDYCDLLGMNSESHCFIVLNVSSTTSYQNDLVWTPYVGWTSVKEYSIFRKNENDAFVKIATVAGDITTYSDLGLCDNDYEYYVQAAHPTKMWLSNSYTVTNRPLYAKNILSSSVKNVSVCGENEISIDWKKSAFSEFSNYMVLKYETTFDNLISETPVTDTFFIDSDVETNEYSYIYRVVEQDRCGYINTPDKEGKSILLKGRYTDGSDLYWTEYQNWENGVEKYNVEIDKSGEFEFTHKNSHHDRDYIDRKYYRDITGEYCYRVYAVGNDNDTSYSNVVCLSGEPKVVIPTGFTPNGDNLNEVFNPISKFIQQGDIEDINNFQFAIYNRWGEQIFETNNAIEGWNGTYKGNDCQQGAYIYTLTATGINKQKLHLKGTITLLR
jgi:gliding motility-associated-like protein